MLVFANAVSASLNTIGFCESLNDLLLRHYQIIILDGDTNSIRLVGTIALLIMIFICSLGMDWESKVSLETKLGNPLKLRFILQRVH